MFATIAALSLVSIFSALFASEPSLDSRDPNPCHDSSWNALVAGLGL